MAQDGAPTKEKPVALSYEALDECLSYLAKIYRFGVQEPTATNVSFHMPRIGCGIAGGEWKQVVRYVVERLDRYEVFVYDLPVSVCLWG